MRNRVKPRCLSKKLRGRFRQLLFTWPFRMARGKTPFLFPKTIEQSIALEDRHGDGSYKERKELLDILLEKLHADEKVDLQEVLGALSRAWAATFRAFNERRQMDTRRERIEEREIVLRNLHRWLKRARGLLATKTIPELVPELQDPDFLHIDALIKGPLFRKSLQPASGRLRRPKAGHQPEPWLGQAHHDLRRAGVTRKEFRKDLLVAVGLQ